MAFLILSLPLFAAQHPNAARGFQIDKVYQAGDVDDVNLYNGNLSVTVPIGQEYSGSGTLKYQFALRYNSKAWDREARSYFYNPVCSPPPGSDLPPDGNTVFCNQPYDVSVPTKSSNAGMGWSLSLGRLMRWNDPSLEEGLVSRPQLWVYESPDGAQHTFIGNDSAGASIDGSFLRMTALNDAAGSHEVFFPDGMVQRFVPGPDNTQRLVDIRDPFGNHLAIAYATSGDWTLTEWDATGHMVREHSVKVHDLRTDAAANHPVNVTANYNFVVSEIDLAAFGGGAPAQYKLAYTTDVTAALPFGVDSLPYSCHSDYRLGATPAPNAPDVYRVPRLHHVLLPDGSHWDFDYTSGGCGAISQLVLPTRGRIEWGYSDYALPTSSCPSPFLTINTYWSDAVFSSVDGVVSRKVFANDGTEYDWFYAQGFEPRTQWQRFWCSDNTSDLKPQQVTTKVTAGKVVNGAFLPELKSEHYFSVSLVAGGWRGGDPTSAFDLSEFGLPFTRATGTGCGTPNATELCLSSREFECPGGQCNANPSRLHYVRYAGDSREPLLGNTDFGYRRPEAERTKYCEDLTEADCHSEHHLDTVRTRYDGLGHYRQEDTTDSWTPATRSEVTEFNPGLVDVTIDPMTWAHSSSPWPASAPSLLNLYDATSVTANGTTRRAQSCFEPSTGFLLRKRTLATSGDGGDVSIGPGDRFGGETPAESDLLAVFDRDAAGNVTRENDYGGDDWPLESGFDTCESLVARIGTYTLVHEYSSGSLSSTGYAPFSYKTLNLTIDGNTGLPSLSTDPAGLITSFAYDAQGRLKLERPPAQAETVYTYNATSTPPNVVIQQFPSGTNLPTSTPPLTERHIYFDGLGRAIQTRTRMPDPAPDDPGDKWSVTQTAYDVFGRVIRTSMPEYRTGGAWEAFTPAHWQTVEYDAFGRPVKSTAPDGKVTTTAYRGIRETKRTQTVAMNATGTETPVTSTTSYDAFGRITAVAEFSGMASNPADPSSAVRTQYGYDVPDGSDPSSATHYLMTVDTTDTTVASGPQQQRTFTYDLRGFLSRELTPEKGLTSYFGYDARGHLLRKQDNAEGKYDLSFSYDGAERQTAILSTDSGKPLKEFTFDSVVDGVQHLTGNGRLLKAVRHNWTTLGDVRVTDYNTAFDAAGRVSAKQTRIDTVLDNGQVASGPVFTQNFSYTDLNQPSAVNYPTCAGCGTAPGPTRSIALGYDHGLLTGLSGFGSLTYSPNGMVHTVVHNGATPLQNTTDRQELDLSGMARVGSIDFTGYCAGPLLPAPLPALVTVQAGHPADFSITITGIASPHYQWYRGARGVITDPVSGATTSSLHIDAVTQSVTFWVRVTGDNGCFSDSEIVTASIRNCDATALSIVTQPQSAVVPSGSQVTLTVASSDPQARFQWYKGLSGDTTAPLANQTASTYACTATASDAYWVRVWTQDGICSVDSAAATVSVCSRPAIVVQPLSQSGPIPTSAQPVTLTTTVVASGYQLHYKWWENSGTGWAEVSPLDSTVSAIDATLTVTFTAPQARTRTFRVEVSSATTISGCSGPPVTSSEVTMQVGSCMTYGGGVEGLYVITPLVNAYDLTVQMAGSGPFHYHWFHGLNGQSIPLPDTGATLRPGLFGDSDAFWCVVTSDHCGGSVTTPKAYFRLWNACPTPQVTVSPAQSIVTTAAPSPTLLATVDWPQPQVTYQWYQGQSGDTSNGTLLTGQTHSTLVVSSVVPATYWVRVTNECDEHADSAAVAVSTSNCDPIVITMQPRSADVMAGDAATLQTDANSARGITNISWFQKGAPDILVGTGPSISTRPSRTTTYYAAIANGCTTVNTFDAVVHVKSCPALLITTQPANVYLQSGSTAGTDMSVAVSPAQGVGTYQWYKGKSGDTSTILQGENHTSLHVTETGDYWVRVFGNACTMDSNTATAVRCAPLSVPATLSGSSIRKGELFHYDARTIATGTELRYAWHKGPATQTDNIVSNVGDLWERPADTTTYELEITSPCGDRAVRSVLVTVCTIPIVTEQPRSVSVFPGRTAVLTVNAFEANDVPVTYQWLNENGNPVGSGKVFETPAITARYSVHVQAGACSSESAEAVVSLCALPEIITTGTTSYVMPQQSVTLSCGTNPASGYSFQWYQGAPGDTSHPVGNDSWQYTAAAETTQSWWVRVSNPADACVSRTTAYTLNVCVPRIGRQPADVTIQAADSTMLSVEASSFATYTWYVGEKGDTSHPVPNGTTSTITVSPASDTRYWVRVVGTCGNDSRGVPIGMADSESALVTVCQPTVVTTGPSLWTSRGVAATLHVAATGTGLTYQWYAGAKGNTSAPIQNATTSSLTVSPQNTSDYWARVTGACDVADSDTITVSVCMTPSITTQPQAVSIFSGSTATLTVAATEAATAPITYQWYTGASGDVSSSVGTNSSSYTTPALTADTSYWVRVSCGTCPPADSVAAVVSICANPLIVPASGDVQTKAGDSIRLYAYGSGAGNVYTWYQGAAGDRSHPVMTGVSVNYLDVAPLATTQYWAEVVNNSCISRTNAITVNVCIPQITQQPSSPNISPGQSATLTVATDLPATYQWYAGTSGNTASPLATGSSVTVSPSSTASYWVRATSTCGRTVDSITATVTVAACNAPQITRQPLTINESLWPKAETVDVLATGSNLTYQWYYGASGDTSAPVLDDVRLGISGASTSALSYYLSQSTRLWVRVSGSCGTRDSDSAWLNVVPKIMGQPQDQSVSYGSTAVVSVSAQGNPLTYQWFNYDTGAALAGSSNSSRVVLPPVTTTVRVYCVVTSGNATITSSPAEISTCDGPIVTLTSSANGPSCRSVSVQINGNYNGIEWYLGQVGDTSSLYATGATSVMICPSTPGTLWCRVWGVDGSGGACNYDSVAVPVP